MKETKNNQKNIGDAGKPQDAQSSEMKTDSGDIDDFIFEGNSRLIHSER
ncbi:MAG: hypothetical protein ACI4QV_01190 [Acutalibacteraceae bacterium]